MGPLEFTQQVEKRFEQLKLEGWIMDLGKWAFGMWAFKAHHGLSKPIMGYFSQKNGPHLSGSPGRPPTLPQAFFLFFQKNDPHILGSPPWALKAHRVQ